MPETVEATRNFILYFVIPLWFLVGFADYWCHRATHIHHTSGVKEALIHALMLFEMAIPVTLALYFEITASVILVMVLMFFVHEATAIWDVAFATSRREIRPIEQHVHSYLGVLPFMVGSVVICLNWSQFHALFGYGPDPVDFGLRWKEPPLSRTYHIGLTLASLVFLVIPYAEEIWRCWRAVPRLKVPVSSEVGLP